MKDNLFDEALQSFSDKICEKQRVNCAKYTELILLADKWSVDEDSILNAKQPKFEEV